LPALDLELHGRLLRLVRDLVEGGRIDGIHDVSDGGLGVAVAEMAVRGNVGFRLEGIAGHAALFGEGPSRVLLSVPPPALEEVRDQLMKAGVGCVQIGVAGGDRLVVDGLVDVSLAAARAAWHGALPGALGDRGAGPGVGAL
jgi:phosphoribosylformylglycinamidine synthase